MARLTHNRRWYQDAALVAPLFRLVGALLAHCRAYVVRLEAPAATDHPVFGWFSGRLSRGLNDALPRVADQLRALWAPPQTAAFLLARLPPPPAPAPRGPLAEACRFYVAAQAVLPRHACVRSLPPFFATKRLAKDGGT